MKNMKTMLVEELRSELTLTKKDAEGFAKNFFEKVATTISKEEDIMIPGVVKLKILSKPEAVRKIPNGKGAVKEITIPARKVVKSVMLKAIKERLNK